MTTRLSMSTRLVARTGRIATLLLTLKTTLRGCSLNQTLPIVAYVASLWSSDHSLPSVLLAVSPHSHHSTLSHHVPLCSLPYRCNHQRA